MRARTRFCSALALTAGLVAGCSGGDVELARLHQAQRDFWRAKHAQQRLDIYPNQAIAEDCLRAYRGIIDRYPPGALPQPVGDPSGIPVKLARVGAMASLAAAGILREQGRQEEGIALLAAACRPDLPLGTFVERRLRSGLASFLIEADRHREAALAYRSMLAPLAPGLDEEHAAFPDAEVLTIPALMIDQARQSGDSALAAELGDYGERYFRRVAEGYPGSDAEWQALLNAADFDIARERWPEAAEILERLAQRFPERQPWRADMRRARLLREQLGRSAEGDAILARWAQSDDQEAAVAAGLQRIRIFLNSGSYDEALSEIPRVKKAIKNREQMAELCYLWGEYELRHGSWEDAGSRWRDASASQPYARYGLESQLAIARQWADRGEPRFAALALAKLFAACRQNTRHRAGSELARLTLAIESRADSLLGTLPATEPTVRNLLSKRGSHSQSS